MNRVFGMLFSAMLVLTPSMLLADEGKKFRVALSKFAWQDLRAMPLLVNRDVAVGDILALDVYEEVKPSGGRCYPNLLLKAEGGNSSRSERARSFSVELNSSFNLSGAFKKAFSGDAGLRSAFENRAAIVFHSVFGTLPDPDVGALNPVLASNQPDCSVLADAWLGSLPNRILVTRVYEGSADAGFVFEGNAAAEASILYQKLKDQGVSTKLLVEADSAKIVAYSWAQGTIAVQSSKVNYDALVRYWIAAQENPESYYELDRLVDEYLRSSDLDVEPDFIDRLWSLWKNLVEEKPDWQSMNFELAAGGPETGRSVAQIETGAFEAVGVFMAAAAILSE